MGIHTTMVLNQLWKKILKKHKILVVIKVIIIMIIIFIVIKKLTNSRRKPGELFSVLINEVWSIWAAAFSFRSSLNETNNPSNKLLYPKTTSYILHESLSIEMSDYILWHELLNRDHWIGSKSGHLSTRTVDRKIIKIINPFQIFSFNER